MDHDCSPSTQMVAKLSSLNGVKKSFRGLVSSQAALLALPYLVNKVSSSAQINDMARDRVDDAKVDEALQRVYGKYLTGDDVLDIIAFLKTSAGKKLTKFEPWIRQLLIENSSDLAIDVAITMITDTTGSPPDDLA